MSDACSFAVDPGSQYLSAQKVHTACMADLNWLLAPPQRQKEVLVLACRVLPTISDFLARRKYSMKKSMHQIVTLAVGFASAAHLHTKLGLALWFSGLVLAFGVPQMSAADVTYIVGTCTSGTRFSTIQAALDASPAPNTVEVCPGQHAEQVTITKPVTLEGITASNGTLAQIILPDSAPTTTTVDADGDVEAAVAQVYVHNVSGGSVNLTNLDVDGMGFGTNDIFFIGVLYEDSSGTINHVITAEQTTNVEGGIAGWGMWIQGGSSKPSVTVENSSLQDAGGGIFAVGETATPDLTVTIKNNFISMDSATANNLVVYDGTDPTVSGNVLNGGLFGIIIDAPTGSITGNTVLGSQIGIELDVDGAAVTSNNVYGAVSAGINVEANSLKTSVIENNTISSVDMGSVYDIIDSSGTGIALNCKKISSNQVHSNTVIASYYGYGDAPTGFGGSNTYAGVVSRVGACTSDSATSKKVAAARQKSQAQLPGNHR